MDEAVVKRIMPHSNEAEQAVIGSMIMDREAVIIASEIRLRWKNYQIVIFIISNMVPYIRLWWSCIMKDANAILLQLKRS